MPIGLLAIIWAASILPEEPPGRDQSFDVPGAALSGGALFALLLALSEGEAWGWTSPATAALVALFVVLGAAFILVERTAVQPLIDLALFRIRPFAAGLASVLVAFSGLFTATFLLPFLLEQGKGYTPAEAGLLLTPLPLSMAIIAPFSGAAADRFGSRVLASAGIAIMVLGLLSLTQLPVDFSIPDLTWRLVVIGVGQGMFMSPNSSAVLGSVPGRRVGTASGTLAQMRVTGQALGIALSAAVVASRLTVYLGGLGAAPTPVQQHVALAAAIQDAFLVAALVAGIGIFTSLVRGSGRAVETKTPISGVSKAS